MPIARKPLKGRFAAGWLRPHVPCDNWGEGGPMRDLIVILALYVAVLAGFAWCGGIRAAGRSIEDWGRRSTGQNERQHSPVS
jgi:hypothetical protein